MFMFIVVLVRIFHIICALLINFQTGLFCIQKAWGPKRLKLFVDHAAVKHFMRSTAKRFLFSFEDHPAFLRFCLPIKTLFI